MRPLSRPSATSAKFGGGESCRATNRLPISAKKNNRQATKTKSPACDAAPKCNPAASRLKVSSVNDSLGEKGRVEVMRGPAVPKKPKMKEAMKPFDHQSRVRNGRILDQPREVTRPKQNAGESENNSRRKEKTKR